MSTQHTTATATPTPTTTTADEGVECGSSGEYVEEVVYEKVTDEEVDDDEQQQQQQQRDADTGRQAHTPAGATTTAAGAGDGAVTKDVTAAVEGLAINSSSSSSSCPHTPVSSHLPSSPSTPAAAAAGGIGDSSTTTAAAGGDGGGAAGGSSSSKEQQQQQQHYMFSGTGDFDLIPPQVEQQASKVAAEVAEFASHMTHKLQDGFLHAFSSSNNNTTQQQQQQQQHSSSGVEPLSAAAADAAAAAASAAAAAAAAAAADIGSKLSSWWGNLDVTLASNNNPGPAVGGDPADKITKSTAPEAPLCATFQLDSAEALVESYSCSLVQTYTCATNSITPAMQVVFEGTLHITDRHCCFQSHDQQQQQLGVTSTTTPARRRPPVTFKISFTDIESATREPNSRKTLAASDLLQIVVNPAAYSGGEGLADSSSSGLVSAGAGRGGGLGGRGVLVTNLAPIVHSIARGGRESSAGAAAGVGAGVGGGGSSSTNSGGGVQEGEGGGGGRWAVVFQDFKPSSGLDGAVALIEHLRDSSS